MAPWRERALSDPRPSLPADDSSDAAVKRFGQDQEGANDETIDRVRPTMTAPANNATVSINTSRIIWPYKAVKLPCRSQISPRIRDECRLTPPAPISAASSAPSGLVPMVSRPHTAESTQKTAAKMARRA